MRWSRCLPPVTSRALRSESSSSGDEERHGSAALTAALGSPGLKAAGRVAEPGCGVLPSRWYEARVVHELMDAVTRGQSMAEQEAMAREASVAILNRMLRGIYRTMFAHVATPARYLQHGHRLWTLYYDSGEPIITEQSPTHHRIDVHRWASHHPFVCRLNQVAAIPLYEAMGCKNVRAERRTCSDGKGAPCTVHVLWG